METIATHAEIAAPARKVLKAITTTSGHKAGGPPSARSARAPASARPSPSPRRAARWSLRPASFGHTRCRVAANGAISGFSD
jgi:hypothetical protein